MKLRPFLLGLLLLPSICFAELNAYQKNVVAAFTAAGTEKPLVAAYEAANAGKATPVQRNVIRNSELIYEDRILYSCVRANLGEGVTLDDAIDKIIAAGQGPALVAAAKSVFDSAEWLAGVSADATPREKALAAATMLAAGSHLDASVKGDYAMRALRRRLVLNYFLSNATNGKCKPSMQAKALVSAGK